MKWTDAQQAAIDARNDTVLVSAAAGSGKTAVLVERVTRLIKAGGDITRMLIVTFTRAAAAEMRERIANALENAGDDPRIAAQARRVGRAQISTIHTFCLRVIHEHFQALNIDPLAHIGEPAMLSSLKTRALDEVLEAAYQAPSLDEQELFSRYSDEEIVDMLGKLHQFLMAQAEPAVWCEEKLQPVLGELKKHPLYRELLAESRLRLSMARELLSACNDTLNRPGAPLRYQKTYQADEELIRLLMEQAENGMLTGGAITFARIATGKREAQEDEAAAQRYKEQREQMKKAAQSARDLLPADIAAAAADLNASIPALRALCALALRFDARYFELKQQKNWLDYQDLEQLCYLALKDDGVRRAVASQYDCVFIDEYQDVSEIQEAIINSVHVENMLFLVGDVKQSIYRFRLADPTLFLRKYRQFSLNDGASHRKILLQQNFRSDRNVLQAVNQVFQGAMRERVTEIEYDEAAALYPGPSAREGQAVELRLLYRAEPETGESETLKKGYFYEAQLVARRIKQLMNEMIVHEKGGEVPLTYRHIVILLRNAASHAAIIAGVLQEAGIPVYSDADAQYFELSEITDMLSILRVLDNPYQDIPLLSALRCPCFNFTEEELASIRIVDVSRETPFYKAFFALAQMDTALGRRVLAAKRRLDAWRLPAMHLPVETTIRLLMDETGLYMRAGAYEDGEARQANLRLLAERAAVNSDCTLHEFLQNVENMRMSDEGKSAKTLSDSENVVRIMTMHKSKGLEFPVVFLMELANRFKSQASAPLLLNAELGGALQYIEPEARLTHPTMAVKAIASANSRKNRAEEARLLYVAMTRAKEKLILLAAPKDIDAERPIWALRGELAAGSARCMLDWVGQALFQGLLQNENRSITTENGARFDIFFDNADELMEERKQAFAVSPVRSAGEVDPLIAWALSRTEAEAPPLKTSVSAVAKHGRTEEDENETPIDKRVSRETLPERPRFMQARGLTATERGTAVHKVLGCIPYDVVRCAEYAKIVQQLDALKSKALISKEERDAVSADDILRFFSSAVGRRALRTDLVRREWPFNLRANEATIVQGVLDLCFLEEGAWVLVDYKTDRFDSLEILRERYQDQMRWYARALRELTGYPVREILLYAIRTGQTISVDDGESGEITP